MEDYVKSWKKSLDQYREWWNDHVNHDGDWNHSHAGAIISLAETVFEEMLRLRERLQFDPGGSDKIDELECAMDFMRHNMKLLEQELEDTQKDVIRIRREFVHRMQSEPSSEVINWMAHEMMELSNKCHAKWPKVVDEKLLIECAEDAVKMFDSDPKNKVFNSAGFSQAFCKRTAVKGSIDGGIVKAMLVGRPWANYDGGSHWMLIDV